MTTFEIDVLAILGMVFVAPVIFVGGTMLLEQWRENHDRKHPT